MSILRKGVDLALRAAWNATRPRDDKAVRKGWGFSPGGSWRSMFPTNWFQLGVDAPTATEAMSSSAVYSCVSILAQEMARLDVHHWRLNDDGSRNMIQGSAAARVMRKPNTYQSRSDWEMYRMQSLLLDGNSYSYAERNAAGGVKAFHPFEPSSVQPYRVEGSLDLFYQVTDHSNRGLIPEGLMIPQRDMLHDRLFTTYDPVIGASPLQALGPSVALGKNIQVQSASFFENMSRPAGVLRTPKPLSPEAATRLQEQWQSGMAGKFVGRTAVLDNDVDWRPLSMSAVDAEIIAQYRLSVENIAQVYRIPLYMLGDMTKATFNNVESLQKAFVISALGFYLKHSENSLWDFFELGPNEYMEYDLERGMMRPDLEQRMSAYAKGILGGVYAPNEPRRRENLPPVEGGDQVYMQRQNWPLEMLGDDAETATSTDASTEDTSAEDEAKDLRTLRLIINKKLDEVA